MAFRLQPDRSLAAEIVRVIREQVGRAVDAAGDPGRPVPDRVHEARTACKKIRAALQLLRPAAAKRVKRENARFRDAARALAPLRDASVLPAALASLGHGAVATRRAFPQVRKVIMAACATPLGDRVRIEAALARFVAEMSKAERRLGRWKPKGRDAWVIRKGFGRTYRRARRAAQAVEDDPSTEALHVFRKRTKAHGFQVRLFRAAHLPAKRAGSDALGRLGDLLGNDHDLAVLDQRVSRLASGRVSRDAIAAIRAAIRARRRQLQAEAGELGRRCFKDRPGEFVRRLTGNWKRAGKKR